MLTNLPGKMRCKADGAREARLINNMIGECLSATQCGKAVNKLFLKLIIKADDTGHRA